MSIFALLFSLFLDSNLLSLQTVYDSMGKQNTPTVPGDNENRFSFLTDVSTTVLLFMYRE